ncbi:MAG: hypothetical protein Q7R79_05195 [bacterium]|nr:hypothetical protein [bacterium]
MHRKKRKSSVKSHTSIVSSRAWVLLSILLFLGIGFIKHFSVKSEIDSVLGTTSPSTGTDESGGDQNNPTPSEPPKNTPPPASDTVPPSQSVSPSTSSTTTSSHTSGDGSSGSNSTTSNTASGVSGSTQVICTGPDQKQFQATFSYCESFNKSWGNTEFSFTTLSSPTKTEPSISAPTPTEQPKIRPSLNATISTTPTPTEKVEPIRATAKDDTPINIAKEDTQTRLEIKDGVPVYKMRDMSRQNFLGFLPVSITKEVTLSTRTGRILSIRKSFLDSVMDFLSY